MIEDDVENPRLKPLKAPPLRRRGEGKEKVKRRLQLVEVRETWSLKMDSDIELIRGKRCLQKWER